MRKHIAYPHERSKLAELLKDHGESEIQWSQDKGYHIEEVKQSVIEEVVEPPLTQDESET